MNFPPKTTERFPDQRFSFISSLFFHIKNANSPTVITIFQTCNNHCVSNAIYEYCFSLDSCSCKYVKLDAILCAFVVDQTTTAMYQLTIQ